MIFSRHTAPGRSPSIKISVIIAAHNTERYIADALRSATAQTYAPHEIIVIDDASTDGTVDAALGSGVPVKLLRGEFRNAAAARNFGIQHATGDWIAILDSDDLWYPHHLQTAVSLLRESGDLVYMSLHDELYEDGSTRTIPRLWPIDKPTGRVSGQDFFEWFYKAHYFSHNGLVAQLDLVRTVGGYDVNQLMRHDIELVLRMVAGRTWAANPLPTCRYRCRRPGALSRNQADRYYYALRAMLQNRVAFAGPAMDDLLCRYARRAMATAWADGDDEDRKRATKDAWPHLTPRNRLFFGAAMICPAMFISLIRLRRKRIAKQHPSTPQ